MRNKKIIFKALLFAVVALIILVTVCNSIVHNAGIGKLFTDSKAIPFNRIGMLLGVPKFRKNGDESLYYNYRVAAAANLIKHKKIKYLIISGDSSKLNYNEPYSMRADLMAAGIDSTIIYLDCAGVRTFDSVVRLKEIFGQDSVTLISQPFHNERALYIASGKGITAIAFNAKDVNGTQDFFTQCREKFARVKVIMDFIFNKKPRYGGARILIPAN